MRRRFESCRGHHTKPQVRGHLGFLALGVEEGRIRPGPHRDRSVLPHRVVQASRGVVQPVGKQVAVAVQSQGRSPVAEHPLHTLDGRTGRDRQGRRRVSQLVRIEAGLTDRLGGSVEVARRKLPTRR